MTYASNDRDRYEPPACPRCHRRPRVNWVEVSTYGHLDQWMPAYLVCDTPACVDENGSNVL